jgi:hypothetical protein
MVDKSPIKLEYFKESIYLKNVNGRIHKIKKTVRKTSLPSSGINLMINVEMVVFMIII